MRTIKFKVWDKKKQEMSPEAYTISAFMDAAKQTGAVMFEEDFVFLQYTGLNDKNGTEIYEGDVLKLGEQVKVVEWNSEYGYLGIFGPNKPLAEDYEIIGNIYTNPELLK